MKKPPIPVLRSGNAAVDNFGVAVKESIDTLTGQTKNTRPLAPVPATATLAQLIAAHNALLERVQGS